MVCSNFHSTRVCKLCLFLFAQFIVPYLLTKYKVGRWLENNLEEGSDGMHKEKAPDIRLRLFFVESGNVLLSQVVSNQVPSALKGLTSVFGMGTGGSLSPLSPEIV